MNCAWPNLSSSLIFLPACVSLSKLFCRSFSLSAPRNPALNRQAAANIKTIRRPQGGEPLLFLLGAFLPPTDPLIRLPDLVGVLVMVQIQKFSVRIEGGLNLIEFIVTKCANKPFPGAGLFELIHHIVASQRRSIISREIKGGGEIFPVDHVALI